MFYLTTHSTHFIYGYMASDIWLRTILIVRKETRCRHIGYSYRLTARVLLYAPSHGQDSTYHGLCYTSRGALAGTRNSSMGPPHEGSIRRPIAPRANALTTELTMNSRQYLVLLFTSDMSSQFQCNTCGAYKEGHELAQCCDGHILCQKCIEPEVKVILTSENQVGLAVFP